MATPGRSDDVAAVDHDDPAFLRGTLLRVALVVLAVLLAVLAGVLTLSALDVRIEPLSTSIAVGGYLLAVAAAVFVWARRRPASARGPIRWGRVGGGLLTAVVLVGSLFLAIAMQPTTVERFVSLQATTPALYSDGVLSVAASGPVDIGWQLRGYDVELDGNAVVTVTLDGAAPTDLVLDLLAEPDSVGAGETSALAGGISFTAPAASGRHEMVIEVVDSADPAYGQRLVMQLVVTG